MGNMDRLGKKLYVLRQRQNLTVRQLGEIFGIDYSHISRIESGQRKPSLELAIQIADFFEIDLNRLVRDELELD
jgi:transcriptional regulator with XRE-family HTH domain